MCSYLGRDSAIKCDSNRAALENRRVIDEGEMANKLFFCAKFPLSNHNNKELPGAARSCQELPGVLDRFFFILESSVLREVWES